MKKNLTHLLERFLFSATLLLFLSINSLQAQSDIRHPNSGTENFCVTAGSTVLYYDAGGLNCDRIQFPGGDYNRNANATAVICPDAPTSDVSIEFLEVDIETRFSGGDCWDRLTIYDGNSTSAPMLFTGCGEDGFNLCPNGQPGDNGDANNMDDGPNDMDGSFDVSPANNFFTSTSADGCLTVKFNSDDTDEDGGWLAQVSASGTNGPSCGDNVTSDGCVNGNFIRLVMYGDFGSGWGQGEMTIRDKATETIVVTTGLTAGSQDVEFYCLPDDCYLIDLCGSFFPQDISWDIYVNGESSPSFSGSGHVTDLEMPLNSVCETVCNDNLLDLDLNLDFLSEQTSWEITDETGNIVASGDNYECTSYNEIICLPDGCYDFSIFDSGADGICCTFGNGSYTLTDENETVLATGAEFGAGETTQFTVGAGTCSPLPSPWNVADIGGEDCNDYDYDDQTDVFSVSGCGNNVFPNNSDNIAFANQSVCGDVEIVAKVESVTPNGYGGITIREGLNGDDKQVSIFSNLSNSLRWETRYATGSNKVVQNFVKPSPIWLKLVRQGDWFFGYYSSNGMSFQYLHAVNVSMSSCVEIGLAGFSYIVGQNATATFSNVSVSGGNIPQPVIGEQETTFTTTAPVEAQLYPNPASKLITIEITPDNNQYTLLNLRNSMGQLIEQRQLEPNAYRTDWEVKALTNGVYFIEISRKGELPSLLRFVKSH